MRFCSGFATTVETKRSNRILLSGCWTRSILYTARRSCAVRKIRWSLWRRIDKAPGSPQRHNCVAKPRDTNRCISATVGPRNGPAPAAAAVKSTTRDSPLSNPFSSWFSPVGAPGARGGHSFFHYWLSKQLFFTHEVWVARGRPSPVRPARLVLHHGGCEGIHHKPHDICPFGLSFCITGGCEG